MVGTIMFLAVLRLIKFIKVLTRKKGKCRGRALKKQTCKGEGLMTAGRIT